MLALSTNTTDASRNARPARRWELVARASVVGRATTAFSIAQKRAAQNARRQVEAMAAMSGTNHGGQMDRRNTRRRTQTTVVRPTTVVRRFSTNDAARSFAEAARGYTPRQLADAADTTIEAAKFWLEAKRAPNSANLLNMAQSLPFVMDWMVRESGGGDRAAQARSHDATRQALLDLSKMEGPEGAVARTILAIAEKGPRQ